MAGAGAGAAPAPARLTAGHRRGKRCAPKGHGRPCAIVQTLGSLTISGQSGRNHVGFAGKLRGKTLRIGRYRLTATPASARARTTAFTVIAAPKHRRAHAGAASLPLGARGPLSAALGAHESAYRVVNLRVSNPAQRLAASFSRDGITVASGSASPPVRSGFQPVGSATPAPL